MLLSLIFLPILMWALIMLWSVLGFLFFIVVVTHNLFISSPVDYFESFMLFGYYEYSYSERPRLCLDAHLFICNTARAKGRCVPYCDRGCLSLPIVLLQQQQHLWAAVFLSPWHSFSVSTRLDGFFSSLGFMLLAGRVRKQEEADVIQGVLEKHFKKKLCPKSLFSKGNVLKLLGE